MRIARLPSLIFGASLVFALSLATVHATARVEGDSEYSKAQTYSGALRYLRVDMGYEVVEKDPDAGYLIFRYELPGQNKATATGTVEVVESDGHVRLFVQIPKMPEYHERVLRDGLVKKLHEDYGAPAHKVPPAPEKKPEDAGAD